MTDADAERAAITAAMQRLLDGTPKRSTGALSVVQLAVEADVKRWVLTHKHTDLADEFRSCVEASGPIPAEQLSIPVDRGVSGDLRFGVLIAV